MQETHEKRNTYLFIGLLVLAGAFHVLEDSLHSHVSVPDYSLVTLVFCLVFLIYSALLLSWIVSVYARLLPSKARAYLIAMALLMLLYLCLRIVRYRIVVSAAALRLTWYAYYVPMVLIPVLFLMVCIQIERGEMRAAWDERLLLIPAVLLAVLVVTNDLHHLIFVPKPGLGSFSGQGGTYTYRLLFYLYYAWMILAVAAGLILLVRACGRGKDRRTVAQFVAILLLWYGLLKLHSLKKIVEFIPPYEAPETSIFSMLAICEICIRKRLIPRNENYAGFFAALPMPVMITDRSLVPVYSSVNGIDADRAQLADALEAPIRLRPDQKLSGKRIRGGCAFWLEDESEVRRANEALSEANELLEGENTLIEYENRQKEQNAWLRSRHHIYHEIAAKMYPWQKRIEALLNEARPDDPGFGDVIAQVSVLNAFVKRKTNLLLMASEREDIPLRELLLAVAESGCYLTYAGIRTSVDESGFLPGGEEVLWPSDRVIALYDSFELLAERLMDRATLLMVSLSEDGLRLAADASGPIRSDGAPLPVRTEAREGVTYLTVRAQEGGD